MWCSVCGVTFMLSLIEGCGWLLWILRHTITLTNCIYSICALCIDYMSISVCRNTHKLVLSLKNSFKSGEKLREMLWLIDKYLLLLPKDGFILYHISQSSEKTCVNHYFSHLIYIYITLCCVCLAVLIPDQGLFTDKLWTTAEYLAHMSMSVPCFTYSQ